MSCDFAIICDECCSYTYVGCFRSSGFRLEKENVECFLGNHIKCGDLKFLSYDLVPDTYSDECNEEQNTYIQSDRII